MKKLAFLAIILITTLSGCSKSDSSSSTFSILGKWKLNYEKYYVKDIETLSYTPKDDYFDFKSDGTLLTFFYGTNETLKYSKVSEEIYQLDGYDYKINKISNNHITLTNNYSSTEKNVYDLTR
jgi:hypothetical protein